MSETQQSDKISHFNFPSVERAVFDNNYLDTVVVELRYPTYLRLKEEEPREVSEAIRERFPIYDPGSEMQVTPLGSTNHQPVYKFTTRKKDPVLEITASHISLTTKKYESFEVFTDYVKYLIETIAPIVDTTFFTRVGLRYINNVAGMEQNGGDLLEWINTDLVKPVAGGEIGTIGAMRNELAGPLENDGSYTFRYGLSPSGKEDRRFVLDWDYYKEDVEVDECIDLLGEFHKMHFPFFWWSLGNKAREALENGTASI